MYITIDYCDNNKGQHILSINRAGIKQGNAEKIGIKSEKQNENYQKENIFYDYLDITYYFNNIKDLLYRCSFEFVHLFSFRLFVRDRQMCSTSK